MHSTKIFGLASSVAALLGAAATAQAFTLNFDGAGSTADAFAPAGLTIGYGQYVPRLDGFGDPISGSEHWEIDPSGGSVPVIDPSTVGYGAAPSLSKALDARDGSVLFVFNTPFDLAHFAATLDNSTFGNPGNSPINFYDANDLLLASISADQTVPGLQLSADNIGLVSSILLPSTAFYDNIEVAPVAAVPEAGTLLWGGIIGIAAAFRRNRSRRA